MKENKLTPEEIIKALECCKPDNDEGCLNCPLTNVPLPECAEILSKESVDLINRQQAEVENCYKFIEQLKEARNLWEDKCKEQQAEIERLQGLLEQWKEEANRYQTLWCEDVQIARAEAIKEFAERLRELMVTDTRYILISEFTLNILVKEMVGDDK